MGIRNIDEARLSELILKDPWMMKVLVVAEELNLPDWWIGAGFLRNKVWNYLEGKASEKTRDVDLVYFDSNNVRDEIDWDYDDHLNKEFPFAIWEVRNQARMHYKNGFDPFASTADGIAHWTETATAVAVKLDNDEITFLFCYGTDDLLNLVARPTPFFARKPEVEVFQKRVKEKNWQEKWPTLKIVLDN